VVFVPWLARFAWSLGVDSWAVLAATATIGWYFQPLIWVGLSPVIFAYYLVFAPRHGPAWHLGLAGATFVGVSPNAWWLSDWVKYWWLRQPIPGDHIPLPDWRAVLGTVHDYPPLFENLPGGMALVFGGVAGLILLARTGHRTAAWLVLTASLFVVMMARVAGAWALVPPNVPNRIMVLAAGFLLPPTVHVLWEALRAARSARVVTVLALGALTAAGWADTPDHSLSRKLGVTAEPLVIGFTPEHRQIIDLLNGKTTPEARVLWDETFSNRTVWNWSALLPLYTNSAYLGGLDPESGVEHAYCAMGSRLLNGRALAEWSDADLIEFCKWYNVGWVVARSPSAIERWGKLSIATPTARLTEEGQPVVFYTLNRRKSYVLNLGDGVAPGASATWESANTRRIVLTNVVPDADGSVKLSLHMLEGLRVSPSYIRVEGMQELRFCSDPIKHVRLWMPGPVPRVTLWWENP
jgi:hypothetical protein